MSKLLDYIKSNGRSPQLSLIINPLESSRKQMVLSQFLTYSFSASVLIPVDAFSFTFTMPGTLGSIYSVIKEGDLIELLANQETICTGLVDQVDIETSVDGGDVVTINGRNLLGQLEDQSCVNAIDAPLWASEISLEGAVGKVKANTRIRGLKTHQVPSGSFLFATEPGESKLSALQRFIEPLNCLVWSDPSGNMIVGRPNMGQDAIGDLFCDRESRSSNVMAVKATRSSSQIPNVYIPIWSGQENVQNRTGVSQRLNNAAEGPKRLRLLNHNVQKTVVVSTPSGSDAQSLSDVNAIKIGGSNLLQAYALREMARANVNELIVQATVKSHFNDDIVPFKVDTIYNINYPRAGVTEKMYLFQAEYSMDASQGPKTALHFCRLGRIVAGISIGQVETQLKAAGKLPK